MTIDSGFLDRSFFLEGLPQELSAGLAGLARLVVLEDDAVLFEAGDPGDGFYALLDGALKVMVFSADGDAQLLAVLGPGTMVGELALFDGRPRSATVMALSPSRLAFIERARFERFADEHPAVYRHMLRIVGGRLRHANDTLAGRAFLPLPGRVAQVLLQLADAFGRPVDETRTLIRHRLSQGEIASMAGAARENVCRVLNDLTRAGTVSRISGYYCIERRHILEAAASL
jgi:CRP/FNR family cyclic AMP-dependent transcriptional regulator